MSEIKGPSAVQIYFSDFFEVSPALVEGYGAFDISLINDLPLFIDPFLLFNSQKPEYQQLHDGIIRYLRFLRDKSAGQALDSALVRAWYRFGEVKQNWMGFSRVGNSGSGLGPNFADSLHESLGTFFNTFGQERVTRGSHLEKVCLISERVGRDNISDFTTNLIKGFLLEYTQTFALAHLRPEQRRAFNIDKVRFNYATEAWVRERYELPNVGGDYVLLTPKDMLTRDEVWISRRDLLNNFEQVAAAIPDEQLRAQLNNYLLSQLPLDPGGTAEEREKEKRRAITKTLAAYPQVIEYYIREKEDDGDRARAISDEKVRKTELQFVEQLRNLVIPRLAGTSFYRYTGDTYQEARERVLYLKHAIEDQDVYRIFYVEGQVIQRESDLQLLFRLVWYATPSDVNREPNNGRGPVDYTISRGSKDKSLVEFKLASNSQLKRNIEKQVPIYEAANDTSKSLKVICYFSAAELAKVQNILRELQQEDNPHIILIDARADNKPSASKA